uniref:Uncharacterized protein n=1 Tax=Arundo donax TaxID=35708 RepID=A0A0A8Z6Q4_ARUDO
MASNHFPNSCNKRKEDAKVDNKNLVYTLKTAIHVFSRQKFYVIEHISYCDTKSDNKLLSHGMTT